MKLSLLELKSKKLSKDIEALDSTTISYYTTFVDMCVSDAKEML